MRYQTSSATKKPESNGGQRKKTLMQRLHFDISLSDFEVLVMRNVVLVGSVAIAFKGNEGEVDHCRTSCLIALYFVMESVHTNFLPAAKQRRSMDHNWPRPLLQSSQGSLYRPEKHGNIGN